MNDRTETTRLKTERWLRFCLCALLIVVAVYLGKSAFDAAWSNLQRVPPNQTANLWSIVESLAVLASLTSAFVLVINLRVSIYLAVSASVVSFSIYAAQLLLQYVSRATDQTYLLSNSYLARSVALPLIFSALSLAVSIMRLRQGFYRTNIAFNL